MKKIIRIGSRKSALAIAQTETVMNSIRKKYPELELELVPMVTTGDLNMKPFSEAGDKFGIKGLFTQELEEALLKGELDIAVHSLKDLPQVQDPRLPLVGFSHRADPRDVLLLPRGANGRVDAPIGCSSARRRLQLAALYPDHAVEPIRGNVITRIKKLDEGQFSMLVLAAAGIIRLGLEERIDRFFSPDEMIPAAGQGVLVCQGRAGEDYYYLDAVTDMDSKDCAMAERSFVAALNGGCSAPVAAYAVLTGQKITLNGFFADDTEKIFKSRISGHRDDAENIGKQLALSIINGVKGTSPLVGVWGRSPHVNLKSVRVGEA